MLGLIQHQQRRLREQNDTLKKLNERLMDMKRKLITQEQHNDELKNRHFKNDIVISDSVIQNMSHISHKDSGGFEIPWQASNEGSTTTVQAGSTLASHSTKAPHISRSMVIRRKGSNVVYAKESRNSIIGGDRRLSLRPSPVTHCQQLPRHQDSFKYADSHTSASSASNHLTHRSSLFGYRNATRSHISHLQSWRDMQLAHNEKDIIE